MTTPQHNPPFVAFESTVGFLSCCTPPMGMGVSQRCPYALFLRLPRQAPRKDAEMRFPLIGFIICCFNFVFWSYRVYWYSELGDRAFAALLAGFCICIGIVLGGSMWG